MKKLISLILVITILASCAGSGKNNIPVSGRDIPSRVPETESSGGLSSLEKAGIGVGVLAAIFISKAIYDKVNEDEIGEQAHKDWQTKGPILPSEYFFSNMTVQGYVKGKWPIAVDFQMSRPGNIVMKIDAQDINPTLIVMDGSTGSRKLQKFNIPPDLGDEPSLAIIQIKAFENNNGREVLIPVKIYGIACGPNAVGSIGIDQINFGPQAIEVNKQQQAIYSFFSHKSFDKAFVSFRKIVDRNGVIGVNQIVKEETLTLPAINESQGRWEGPRNWDGKSMNNQPSAGLHVLQVRAWYEDPKKLDWDVSLSPDWVNVKL